MTIQSSLTETELLTHTIFSPLEIERFGVAAELGKRFVHYSSAEAAMNILENREIWMRKPSLMNDFTEFKYGRELLLNVYGHHDVGKKFRSLLNRMFPGFCDELEKKINVWLPWFRNETYILCMSEHLPEEDEIGRLSMWRAYGGETGVAIVMKNTPFVQVTDKLAAYSSPISYVNKDGFLNAFKVMVDAMEVNFDFVKSLSRGVVMNHIFEMMRTKILCTKHPGFHEEREWRIYYSPPYQMSETIIPDLKIIGGVPQTIQKIPLKNDPEAGLYGADIPNLLDQLIIGPTEYSEAIFEAFAKVLMNAGVKNPSSMISVSDIPLRR
ncbi:MAG: hypothetical protein COA62_04515 [Rhodobiaceae bacterium]|nr:MAG: hypothetical protein COA62_04515 [Rhodobiaceae bacterium]